MRSRILTLLFSLFSLSAILKAQGGEEVSFYAKADYSPITDMTNIEVAIGNTADALPLMRRYYDGVYEAHPSVLANLSKPSHYVIIGKKWKTVTEQIEGIQRYYSAQAKHSTNIVLLYAGSLDLAADSVASVLRMCDAIYVTKRADEVGLDVLTQAFWSGVAVDTAKEIVPIVGLQGREQKKTRLSFGLVSDTSIVLLNKKIDEIANGAIDANATPGLSVIVAQRGNVVVNKQYGHTTYQKTNEVTPYTIYDIASLSKVVGTLPQIISLVDRGQLNVEQTLAELLGTSGWQGKIKVSQLLLHTSGLPAGVPLFALAVDSSSFESPLLARKRGPKHQQKIGKNLYLNNTVRLRQSYFAENEDMTHTIRVGRSMYASDSLRLVVWRHIANLPQASPKYRYSDINFLYLQKIIEKKNGKKLDMLFDATMAAPLGLSRMTYHPTSKYRLNEISPTADDTFFRHEMVWTTVHDETSAALGGVAGNAGLFATANEIVKIGQLFLNGGIYGGVRLFGQETFDQFIVRHDPFCRRGYGFDMPERKNGKSGPVPDCMPKTSYGHTGFTGTMLWIDPEREVVFVFMSNRIHPSVDNTKLTQLDIRSKMLEAITRFLRP